MAIQNRRGAYTDFDPSKMLPGEYAVVLSDDPNGNEGYAIYMCFSSGTVKRIVLEGDLADMFLNLASEYDSTSSYSVGNYCLHDHQFYKCTTAIGSGGETWNRNHWTSTTIAEEIMTAMVSGWTATDPNNDGNIVIT